MSLLAASFGFATPAPAAEPAGEGLGSLHVLITGFESSAGKVAVAVFDSAQSYEDREPAVAKAFVPVVDGESHWRVNLPLDRRYVVIAYHDENGNRELDMRRLFGIPKEPVGVSNNVRAPFGPPKFEAASFVLTAVQQTIEIQLQ